METGFFLSSAKSGKNVGIWVLYNHNRDWPGRSLSLRGLSKGFFHQRSAFQCEVDHVGRVHRAQGYRYSDLYTLLIDERSAGASDSDISALIAAYQQKFGTVSLLPRSSLQLSLF